MGVDFSSVNLRILSPDGKTVLAELQTLDRVGQRTARNIAGAGKAAVEDFSRHAALTSRRVAGELSMIAHEGALSARSLKSVAIEASNAAFAFGPAGVIAGAVALTGVAIFNMFKRTREEIEATARKAREELEKLARSQDLGGTGRAAQFLFSGDPFAAIGGKREGESDNQFLARTRGILGVRAEIARQQAIAEAGTTRSAGGSRFTVLTVEARKAGNALRELRDIEKQLNEQHQAALGLLGQLADAEGFRAAKVVEGLREQTQAGRDKTLADLTRGGVPGVSLIGKPFAAASTDVLGQNLLAAVQEGLKKTPPLPPGVLTDELQRIMSLDAAADQIGDSFGQSLVQSISDGIQAGVRGGFGAGFKALLGGVLQGLGQVFEQIGAKALIGLGFMKRIKDAIMLFLPEVGIPAALGLIAFGAVLSAAGAGLSASGGRGGGGSSYGSSSGFSDTRYVGVVNPLVSPAPNTAGLKASQPIAVQATFIGARDPKVQRDILELLKFARERGEV